MRKTKITELTPEQIAKFPSYVEEWKGYGLSTVPADRPRAEAVKRGNTAKERRAMDEPSYEIVSRLLLADFEGGRLFWRERSPDVFNETEGRSAKHSCARWNSKHAGKEAFTAESGRGYRHGAIFGRMYLAHRVIWLLHTGEWPAEQIDHVNGIRSDNRVVNLRAVSHAENGRNQRIRSTNTSGVVGVHWCKTRGKWKAKINIPGRQKHIGLFDDFDSAVAARKAAGAKYGFHENHGRRVA